MMDTNADCDNCSWEGTLEEKLEVLLSENQQSEEIAKILNQLDKQKMSPLCDTELKLIVLHCLECSRVMKHFKTGFDYTSGDIFILNNIHYISINVSSSGDNALTILIEKVREENIDIALKYARRIQKFF